MIVSERYTENTKRLQETVQSMGFDTRIVVLKDDGFLPAGVLSPYDYFVYGQARDGLEERELFYDFLEVPEFWEIRSGDVKHGEIYDMGRKKADIYFTEPLEKKNVQRVEWCMENGWVYKIDYYNKYALKYASAFLDRDGNVESKVFYSVANQEIIVEQPQNNVFSLLERGQTKAFFTSYAEFIEYYLKEINQTEKCGLLIQDDEEFHLLELRPEGRSMWEYVLFSKQELLDKYIGMGGKKGYRFYDIPQEYPSNAAKGAALILTSVDWLEGIEYLIQEVPEMVFHIGASTQVSEKLHRLGEQENVEVYPQLSRQKLKELWKECDFYLDINHYWESYDAIDTAHRQNLLLVGFEHTLHRRELVVEECIFSKDDKEGLAQMLKGLIGHADLVQERLAGQQEKRREIWMNLRKDGEL